jgi:hypothetical protein
MPAAVTELLVSEQPSFDDAVTFGATAATNDEWQDDTDNEPIDSQDYELMFANRAERIVGCFHWATHSLSF